MLQAHMSATLGPIEYHLKTVSNPQSTADLVALIIPAKVSFNLSKSRQSVRYFSLNCVTQPQ